MSVNFKIKKRSKDQGHIMRATSKEKEVNDLYAILNKI